MKNIDWGILANHLAGRATGEEKKILADWLAERPENRDFLNRIEKMWLTEVRPSSRVDTEKALRLVMSRIQQSSPATVPADRRISSPVFRRPVLEFMARPMVLRAAAVVAVAIGIVTLVTLFSPKRDSGISSVTFSSLQTLELTDGTRITFDVGSSFKYPNSFEGATEREVFLDGEAYFEVARDDEHPFTIHANGATIAVLGTSFAVRAWRSDEHVVVAVKEGRVSLQPEINDDTSKIVYLTQNMMSKLSRTNDSPTPPEAIDFSSYLSWMKKELYFQNTPASEVFRQVERWYNVRIHTADTSILHENITVFIRNKPLIENLEVLSIIMNMKTEQTGDTVRFVPR